MATRKVTTPLPTDPIALVLYKCFENPTFFEQLLRNAKNALKKEHIVLSESDLTLITNELAGLGVEGISTMRFMFALTKVNKGALTSIGLKGPVPPWSNPGTFKRWINHMRDHFGPKPGPTP